jgi:hypothetical protein
MLPSDGPKNTNHLVFKKLVIMLLSRYIFFLEWFAKFHPQLNSHLRQFSLVAPWEYILLNQNQLSKRKLLHHVVLYGLQRGTSRSSELRIVQHWKLPCVRLVIGVRGGRGCGRRRRKWLTRLSILPMACGSACSRAAQEGKKKAPLFTS